MTTSPYMPDVKVEIAFNAGFGTPAGSRTWTDVSQWVELKEGISITGGRQDERATADANQLSLTLDNSDGRFTAGRLTSPYYPNVKLDRPIRVTATPVDGSASVRFVGYVNEWPLEWDGTANYASVALTASSRLARLGYVAGLRSIVEEVILADSPFVYYPLGEPAGSMSAADASGRGQNPLTVSGDSTLPVTFGSATGPGTDSLTAAQFQNGQYLTADLPGAAGDVTFECFFNCPSIPTAFEPMMRTTSPVTAGAVLNISNGTGYLGGSNVVSSVNVADGRTHHAAFVVSGTNRLLYLDGVQIASAVFGTYPAWTNLTVGLLYTGVVAHAAVTARALSAAELKAHADAGLTGYEGDRTDVRFARYAALGNVAPGEVVAEAGTTTMVHVDTTDKQVVEMMRLVETTEGGVVFDGRDGSLVMQSRRHRYTATPAYVLDMGKHMVETAYAPTLDRSKLLNDVSASNSDGTVTARQTDTASVNDYGPVTSSIETASVDPGEPLQVASWQVMTYKDPKTRAPNLTVDALAQVGKTPNCSAVMATNLGDLVTVAAHPNQAAFANTNYFVEGYSETYGLESLRFVFNVSPGSPYDQVFVLDDPVRGVLDSAYILAY